MNRTQLLAMLHMQWNMNAKVNPDWQNAGYPFLRAAVVEGAEAMEHHGWKWWKKQEMDKAQFSMELVDIWHFVLSHMILTEEEHAADTILGQLASEYMTKGITFDGTYFVFERLSTLERVELLIGLSVARRVSIPLFESLMRDVGMNWDELYRQYVGKNVLNFFRQDHGYKEGTYVKIWNGREDNEVLVDILNSFDSDHGDLAQLLYDRLDDAYSDANMSRGMLA